jgi:hypothetical protein
MLGSIFGLGVHIKGGLQPGQPQLHCVGCVHTVCALHISDYITGHAHDGSVLPGQHLYAYKVAEISPRCLGSIFRRTYIWVFGLTAKYYFRRVVYV